MIKNFYKITSFLGGEDSIWFSWWRPVALQEGTKFLKTCTVPPRPWRHSPIGSAFH